MHKRLALLHPLPLLQSPISPSPCMLILGHFINKSYLLWKILSHAEHKLCLFILISLTCNALQLLHTDTSSFQLPVDGGIVDRDEPVCLKQVEEFIVKKIIRILADETKKVFNVFIVK